MELVLHIGPHKTGTTTLQRYLHDKLGARVPAGADWYPVFAEGNANQQALRLLHGRANELANVRDRAARAGVQRLFLSAEAFCVAGADGLQALAGLTQEHPLHLLVTLNSPIRRAASMWQELVKHKFKHGLEDYPERVLAHPGFQPELVDRFMQALQPARTSVLIASADDPPATLIERFAGLFALSTEDMAADGGRNARLGYIEAEMWRHMNLLLKYYQPDFMRSEAYGVLREHLWALLASAEWKARCPQVPIPLPRDVYHELDGLATRTARRLRLLAEQQAIALLGSPESLYDRHGVVIASGPALADYRAQLLDTLRKMD